MENWRRAERGGAEAALAGTKGRSCSVQRDSICKSYVIRLDIRSVHDARIGKFDTERERGGGLRGKRPRSFV